MTDGPTFTPVEVCAAGGVVLRPRKKPGKKPKVLLVHRPRYDDWSHPKGKLDDGETFQDAAVREVEEETGCACRLLGELSPITYEDRQGRLKLVRYWLMTPRRQRERPPDDEIDELRWVRVGQARELLTHDWDHHLLDEALDRMERS